MDNEKYNSIAFCTSDYEEYYDYDHKKHIDYDAMWNDIKDFIRIAVKNGYQMRIWSDDFTLVVEYNYQDQGLSGVSLEWLDENEYIEKYYTSETTEETEE